MSTNMERSYCSYPYVNINIILYYIILIFYNYNLIRLVMLGYNPVIDFYYRVGSINSRYLNLGLENTSTQYPICLKIVLLWTN